MCIKEAEKQQKGERQSAYKRERETEQDKMIVIGNSFCLPSSATIQELFSVAMEGGVVPDISLDDSLTSFLSLDSSSALEHQYSSLQHSLSAGQLATFNQGLTSALGGSTKVSYGGVGVVALALSLLFDILAHQVKHQGGGDRDAVDHIQRASGIRNSSRIGSIINGYLSQVPGIANNLEKMSEVTELYDQGLKYELIDHYERMTNKKRMSSETMRQWMAGAAFHLHLRVHQIRLGSVPRGSAESLRLSYRTGFSRLVQGYTAYLRRNVQEMAPTQGSSRVAGFRMAVGPSDTLPKPTKAIDPAELRASSNSGQSEPSGLSGPVLEPRGTLGPVKPALEPSVDSGSVGSRLGLLVLEPLRTLSHGVQHRPCESPAIADALVTRIMAAQDLEHVREFFQHSEKYFNRLLSQKKSFEL